MDYYLVDLTDYEPDIYFTFMTEAEAEKLRAIMRASHIIGVIEKIGKANGFNKYQHILKMIQDRSEDNFDPFA